MPNVKWTSDNLQKLRELYTELSSEEIGKLLGFTAKAVKSKARVLGIKKRILFTSEEIEYIRSNYSDTDTKVIADHLKRPVHSIYNIANRFSLEKSESYLLTPASGRIQKGSAKVSIGSEFRFRKGQAPTNKGKRQVEFMSPEAIDRTKATRFKKGSLPHNTKSDGIISIRRSKGRPYKYIRQALGQWEQLHRVLWEAHHGKIKEGYNVQFRDGNSLNCVIENLYLISRKKQLSMNNSIHRFPPEIKKTIRTLSKLKRQIKNHEKQN